MLNNINIENILFLDIETVPMARDYGTMPENFRKVFLSVYVLHGEAGEVNVRVDRE